MKHTKVTWLILLVIFAIVLIACQSAGDEVQVDPAAETEAAAEQSNPVMGPGSSMMSRHHATIPDEYTKQSNPLTQDEETLASGAEIYTTQCASCHGEEGLGDGIAAGGLDPQPAPLIHTGRMLGDNYLFWRVSEGGAMAPFNSAMPAWKSSLEEEERWQVISYIRQMSGGQPAAATFDPQAEAEQRAKMLDKALVQEVVSEEEAELFDAVHSQMDAVLAENGSMPGGMMGSNQNDLMATLVDQGVISEDEARAFNDVHDRLLAAGLMQ
jgi:mono/diheme cytochrome c family protein